LSAALGACAEKAAGAPPQTQGVQASTSAPAAAAPEGRMVPIPAGTYQMGATDGEADEAPVHPVKVDAFELDLSEVSTGDYQACVTSGKCTAATTDGHCNAGRPDRQSDPINCVDWNQATAYCASVGKRLPTEEEWEYAARGSDGRKFPWGNTPPTADVACWNRFSSHAGTCRIGTTGGKSPFGIADMAGNVWEWTSSAYCDYPTTSCSGSRRVNRGGGWNADETQILRTTNRIWGAPDHRNSNLGFRCARSAGPKTPG
jgi:formylglycine-generating enzyme required for sulfatase activity